MSKHSFTSIAIILIASFAISACSVFNSLSSPSFLEVHKGMTMNEVLDKYGKPSRKRFDKIREEWEYDRINNCYIIIFENERVVGMDTESGQTAPVQNSSEPQVIVRQQPVIITPEREYGHYPLSYPRIMNDKEFQNFLSRIKAQNFDSDRKNIIEIDAIYNCFTGKQCAALMRTCAFDDDRIWILRKIAPRLIGGDYWEIMDALTFDSSKGKAKQILKRNRNEKEYPYGYMRVMNENEFKKFISSVRNATFSDDKRSLIESTALGNYFTCKQCTELMNLYRFDDEKMWVLRQIAPRLIGGDYWIIINSLTYNSSKEEAKHLLRNRK